MNPQIQNHDSMLKESIKHFLTSYHRGSSDFSSFESIFFRLIQSMLDPPLGVTWFYSAVTFHAAKSSSQNSTHPSARIVITKDLLNLLISCSNLSSASKKISLLAPVVYELYNIVCDYGRAVNMEVRKLVEDMVSYVMTSAAAYDYGNVDANCDNLVVCFEDLVRVWTTDRGGGVCNFEENSRVFFPLLSSGIWKWVSGGGCGVRELVGIVLCEMYFLRMFVTFGSGMCKEDFLRDTFDQTVQTIKEFQSSCFLVKDSIRVFLDNYPIDNSGFSDLLPLFNRFIESSNDPPLEIIWFYGAIDFQSSKSDNLPPPAKLSSAKELFELLNSCTCSCSVLKKVAVIAPVLYLFYHLVIDFSERDPCLRDEIGILLEEIISYISICCSQYLDGGEQEPDRLGTCVSDLIRAWTVDRIRPSHEKDLLEFFFPNLKSDFQREAIVCVQNMAGVVMNEAFLLRLYMKVSTEISKDGLQKNMLNLAIQSIKGFRNFYFLDVLLKMLLEPSLPIASLLSFEEADILHKALYDAVILIDYSFYAGRWAQSNDGHSKNLALLWVLVAERAIHFARAKNDEDSAILYLRAFRESQLMAELIEWARIQAGDVNRNNRPDVTTPNALIKWLFAVEDQGIRVFDHSVSLLYAKAVSKVETNGDHEMAGPSDRFMSTENGAGRKRKETESGQQETRVTQVRRVSDNETHFGVEILNISSEDDMES
ncbi:hypothetical protein PHJA_000952100 [Phtheirospermum japonicum]|uniref:Uncharacterized protein n=1 Tax=Phtheirospermum japonicum TaxID=374723 RepID=A0A830BUK9_9LAMI|nr:hypothetical protein PHJA_000952100 [Phtheirospermum japonicum]